MTSRTTQGRRKVGRKRREREREENKNVISTNFQLVSTFYLGVFELLVLCKLALDWRKKLASARGVRWGWGWITGLSLDISH